MTENRVKKIKSKLKESEIRYRRLFETAHDGILILNPKNARITDVNPFLIKMLGYSKDEFLKKKLWEVGAFKNTKAAKDSFNVLQKEGYVRYDDLPLETKDGKSVSVEFVSNSYIAGSALVIQCNIRDITERKQLESVKEKIRIAAEEKLRVESIADTTHELRTPVAIIKGNIDLALKKLKSPIGALKAIDGEIKHLSEIISDLTLVTSGKWELKNKITFKKVKIKSLIEMVVVRCKTLAYKKKITITVKPIPNIDILGDKTYLEKMLTNIVKNSIVYGKKGGHTEITLKKDSKSITISVVDDGIGIYEEDLPHIFERFYRKENSHRLDGKSVGLGLYIVKSIVETHGGKISVASTKNKGSTFSVSLPIRADN